MHNSSKRLQIGSSLTQTQAGLFEGHRSITHRQHCNSRKAIPAGVAATAAGLVGAGALGVGLGGRVCGAGRLVGRLVGGAGAQHVLELRHVLHHVADLHERHAVLARRRRLALARVAENLQLCSVEEVHVLDNIAAAFELFLKTTRDDTGSITVLNSDGRSLNRSPYCPTPISITLLVKFIAYGKGEGI